MYRIIRKILFQLDPELAHNLVLSLLRVVGGISGIKFLWDKIYPSPYQPVHAFGITFPNALGLAAGYDKDGLAWRGLALLGFGHIEIGTVTPLPQPGNPKPRIFRLTNDRALINRMGFPSRGAEFVRHQIKNKPHKGLILGLNMGKNKSTPNEIAVQDYLYLVDVFYSSVDYLVVNVSSPNTEGLRRLQGRKNLLSLLTQLSERRQNLRNMTGSWTPLLVKISPDLSYNELDDVLDVISISNMDGIIATNTTLSRPGLSSPSAQEKGGLSGIPLKKRSTEIIRWIYRQTNGKLPIIGVGGVENINDYREKLDAGAVLVQIYTGLVYQRPGIVRKILNC